MREGEGQSRVCQAGTPNAIKGEGQSRVCERVRASHESPGGSDSRRR